MRFSLCLRYCCWVKKDSLCQQNVHQCYKKVFLIVFYKCVLPCLQCFHTNGRFAGTTVPTVCFGEEKQCMSVSNSFIFFWAPAFSDMQPQDGNRRQPSEGRAKASCYSTAARGSKSIPLALLGNSGCQRTEGWVIFPLQKYHRDSKSERCQLETELTLLGRQDFR